ncbi:MAG TPA: hypothetical protein VGJ01_06055 [Pseudolabrys sp.]
MRAMSLLYSSTTLGSLTLQNRFVMSPMTRNRAPGNIPNDLMAQYYAQRASAGLIVTEGTSPLPKGWAIRASLAFSRPSRRPAGRRSPTRCIRRAPRSSSN